MESAFLFRFSMVVSHLPQFSLFHFGASGGAILSLSLAKEKEQPKKEKAAWASDTAKEDGRLAVKRPSRTVISPTAKHGKGKEKGFIAVVEKTTNSLLSSCACARVRFRFSVRTVTGVKLDQRIAAGAPSFSILHS